MKKILDICIPAAYTVSRTAKTLWVKSPRRLIFLHRNPGVPHGQHPEAPPAAREFRAKAKKAGVIKDCLKIVERY